MTLDKFIKQCEKINDGENLPEEYLTSVYNDISKKEITSLSTKDFLYEDNLPYGFFLKNLLFYLRNLAIFLLN